MFPALYLNYIYSEKCWEYFLTYTQVKYGTLIWVMQLNPNTNYHISKYFDNGKVFHFWVSFSGRHFGKSIQRGISHLLLMFSFMLMKLISGTLPLSFCPFSQFCFRKGVVACLVSKSGNKNRHTHLGSGLMPLGFCIFTENIHPAFFAKEQVCTLVKAHPP